MFVPGKESREGWREKFEDQARWRREQAAEYPDDQRNVEAAEIFDRLAATVQNVPPEVLAVVDELYFGGPLNNDEIDHETMEAEQEKLRSVGFHTFPESAEEFLRELIAERT